jgi:hypothetical protein
MSKSLKELIDDSVSRVRDSVRENEIVAHLRQLAGPEVLVILQNLVQRKSPSALAIATRVVNNRELAEQFFSFALPHSDAQGIKHLLEFAVAKLGSRAVIRALSERKTDDSQLVEKALYWLPSLVRQEDAALLEELKRQ